MKSSNGDQDRSTTEADAYESADTAEGQTGESVDRGDGSRTEVEETDLDVREEMQVMRDQYLRLLAEFDNYRKRTDRERTESRDRAQAQLVERLLDPLDDLQRVARFGAEATTVDALLEGVRMVERKVLRILEGFGLESVEARGARFDPEVHEAIMTAHTDVPEEDETVGEVFQPGYRLRGTLLRPARVQVKKNG